MLTQLRTAKIKFYLRYMQQNGHADAAVLDGTDLTPRKLADRHHLVEVSDYIRIISNVHRLSRSPALAFELGKHLMLGDLGLLGYCVMSCDSTDEATRLWHQYNAVFFGSLIGMRFDQVGDRTLVSYIPYTDIREDLLQFLIEEKVACDMALQRLIGLDEFPLEQLSLSYAAPSYLHRYQELIRCSIQFSAPHNSMLLRKNALNIPLRGGDPETHEHCMKLLNEVTSSIDSGATLSHRVKAIIYKNLSRPLSAEEVSEQLCCTSRTLHRKLGKEGVNFTDLNIATRLEATKNLIATTNLESKEIAGRVGFADLRSLRRFFKSYTGKTIQQFRQDTVAERIGLIH